MLGDLIKNLPLLAILFSLFNSSVIAENNSFYAVGGLPLLPNESISFNEPTFNISGNTANSMTGSQARVQGTDGHTLWAMTVSSPNKQPLAPGCYIGIPSVGTLNPLYGSIVTGAGRSCANPVSHLRIYEIEIAESSKLNRFAADSIQYCSDKTPMLSSVRFNSTIDSSNLKEKGSLFKSFGCCNKYIIRPANGRKNITLILKDTSLRTSNGKIVGSILGTEGILKVKHQGKQFSSDYSELGLAVKAKVPGTTLSYDVSSRYSHAIAINRLNVANAVYLAGTNGLLYRIDHKPGQFQRLIAVKTGRIKRTSCS